MYRSIMHLSEVHVRMLITYTHFYAGIRFLHAIFAHHTVRKNGQTEEHSGKNGHR